jgi:lipid-A-disaccharide synthase-like uncharacterized protein
MTMDGIWLGIGLTGQACFTARFVAQWIASERKRDSVVPVAFWWFSLAGGLTVLSYAIYKQDPVFIIGQSAGVFIYVRNLMLIAKGKRRAARREARAAEGAMPVPRPHAPEAGARGPRVHKGTFPNGTQ